MTAKEQKKIVLSSEVMQWIEKKSKDDGKEYEPSSSSGKLSLKEVKELKANLSLMRSSALYLMDISVLMGRGTGNISLDLKDLITNEDQANVLEGKNVRTTMQISKMLTNAATKLRSVRAKIIATYFRKFGEIYVCPAENLEPVQLMIQELFAEAENQRKAVYELHSLAYRGFLVDIAEIALNRGYSEEQTLTVLEKYASNFPTKHQIRSQIQIVVTPPIKLPSIEELIEKDSSLKQAELQRVLAQTKIEQEKLRQEQIRREAQSAEQIRQMAEQQMRSHISSVVDAASGHFIALVEEMLERMVGSPPVNNPAEQTKFRQNMAELQHFLEFQDGSLQSMFGEIEELQKLFDGRSDSVEARKQNLLKKIESISDKYKPKFTSAKVVGKGHRRSALAGMDL